MIVGTAGHIDHGKTALVRALTGVDTDRLPEEKRRGITIELGFAPLVLDEAEFSGTLGVVDVPGHEAFVRTMLAGATGIDLAMLVIAADEGVMPQTREHLQILTLLGVRGGVVALTKSDLVEDDWLRLVEDDVRALLRGSALERAAIVRCSAVSREGLDALRAALARVAGDAPQRDAADLVRLPIDRAFSVKGTGTVVTGTLWSGTLDRESAVSVYPPGRTARIRTLESHGKPVERAIPGSRVAVALAGVDREDIARGAFLVAAEDPWTPSSVLRADVALLDGSPPIGIRTRIRLHLGTTEVGARLVAAGGRVEPGSIVPVRIVVDEPLLARGGDRFVLRASTPPVTIGGGVVSDPGPLGRRAKPWAHAGEGPLIRLGRLIAESGGSGLAAGEVPVRVGSTPAEGRELTARVVGATLIESRLYSTELVSVLGSRLTGMVESFHAQHPLEAGFSLQHARTSLRVSEALFDSVVKDLTSRRQLTLTGGVLARTGWTAGAGGKDTARLDRLAEALVAAGPEPPSVGELAAKFGADTPALLRLLERNGRAIAVASDRYFSVVAVEALVTALRRHASDGVPRTASQIREILGLTRKYLIPFLEYCDRAGISSRTGDTRVIRPVP